MSDGLFFIAVLFFFFLLWFVSGGPTRPISFAGPYITPITDVDTVQEGYGDTSSWNGGWWSVSAGGAAQSGGGGNVSGGVTAELSAQERTRRILGLESDLWRLQDDLSDAKLFGEPSVYKDQVTIMGAPRGTGPDDEYFSIQLSYTAKSSVTISGWTLRSEATGRSATIPYGATIPATGVNTVGPIVLEPGQQAIIVTGESPIGVSFKENMCVGYLGQRQTFVPSLYSQCPAPTTEFDRYYGGNTLSDDECYQYVQSLPQCTNDTARTDDLSSTCQAFTDRYLNYSGCVAAHRSEARFAGTTWRVYLERGSRIWKDSREAIKLLDTSGRTVDLYTY